MNIITLAVLLSLAFGALGYFCADTRYWKGKLRCAGYTAFWVGIICVIICSGIYCCSYDSYIELQGKRQVIDAAYKNAVILFTEKANTPTMPSDTSIANTDSKYSGYQEFLWHAIANYREQVDSYNQKVVEKEAMKLSAFYSPLIYYPEPLPLYKLDTKLVTGQ